MSSIFCRSVGDRPTLQFSAPFLFHGHHKPLRAVKTSFVIHDGLVGCLYLDGGAAVCATLCYTVGFPGTGTKRQLELVSPLQSRKHRSVWETGRALIMLQHLGLLFLLGAGSVGERSRVEVIWSECRRVVHSLQLPQWSPNSKRGHGDG